MSAVLVTGATGFLGSNLTRQLVSEGYDVRIYRRASSSLDLLGDTARDVEHAVGDIHDAVALDSAMQGIEHVYHAAASVSFGGRRLRERLLRVNVDGTAAVVNAAVKHRVRRLLHVSSMAAFGRPERTDAVIDEGVHWQRSKANTTYAYSKYLSELEVHRGAAEGLNAVIVNPSLIFGVGRPGDNTRRIVDRVRRESLPAVPTGSTNVVDVQDVVDGVRLAMHRGRAGDRYFLGSENLSWKDIFSTMASAFGVDPPHFMLPRRPAVVLGMMAEGWSYLTGTEPKLTRETARSASRTYRYSNRKACEELGWSPRPFDATAQRLAQALDGVN